MNILVDCGKLNIEQILRASSLANSLHTKHIDSKIYFFIPYIQPLDLLNQNPYITGISIERPKALKGYDEVIQPTPEDLINVECEFHTVPKHDREIIKDFQEMMRNNDQKIITYQAGMGVDPKSLNELRKKYHMIRVGSKTGLYDPDNTSFLFAAEASLIKASDFFLGIPGIYATLATGLGTRNWLLTNYTLSYQGDVLLDSIIWNIENEN